MATTATPAEGAAQGQTHSSTAAEGGHGGGLPQLNPAHYPSMLLWLAISFGLLYLLLSRLLLPMVEGALLRRRHQIEQDLAGARHLQSQSEKAAAAYEAALAEARARASGIAGDMRSKLSAEVDAERAKVDSDMLAKITEAEREIAATKTAALGEVDKITTGIVGDIVNRLIGKTPSSPEIAAAISAEKAEPSH